MLWYKAWLETRWRMLMPLAMILFVLFARRDATPAASKNALFAAQPSFTVFWMLGSLLLAASGIDTMSPFRVYRGLHGSVYYTLSLPVSRWKLFSSRLMFGIAANAVFIAVTGALAAFLSPDIRMLVAPADGLRYAASVFLFSFAVYGLATLYSTFLDQQFQTMATVATFAALQWAVNMSPALSHFGLMHVLSDQSLLIAHKAIWSTAFAWFGVGVVFLFAAWKVVEAREY